MLDLKNAASGGGTLSDFGGTGSGAMTYDGAGNRLSMPVSLPGTSYGGTTSYSYDGRDQLTQESSTRYGGYANAFQYDGFTSGTSTGPGNPTLMRGTSHSFNAGDQDTGIACDGIGNPTTYRGSGLTFDPENRMTGYGSVLACGYDGDGLRSGRLTSSCRDAGLAAAPQRLGDDAGGTAARGPEHAAAGVGARARQKQAINRGPVLGQFGQGAEGEHLVQRHL